MISYATTSLGSVRESTLEQWMKSALAAARDGVERGEHPFGAAIYQADGQNISIACNTAASTKNPLAHAEVNAIELACQTLSRLSLEECWLLTTAEPCPMCLSAAAVAGIRHIAFGASQAVVKEAGYGDFGVEAHELAEQLKVRLQSPVLGNDCVSFMLANRKK